MFYHASQTPSLRELTPHMSEHGKALVYFSEKRENVLVYLSNGVEKFCKETGVEHSGAYAKWASYGFRDDILQLDEYYPNALADTYKGVSGYIYSAQSINAGALLENIPFAHITADTVAIDSAEYVTDAYDAILQAESDGLITIGRYEDKSDNELEWIRKTVMAEYDKNSTRPEYRAFLKAKFGGVIK